MSRRTLTFSEFTASQARIYDELMARKRAALKAEAERWNAMCDSDPIDSVREGLEDIAAGRVRVVTSIEELFGEDED